MNILKIDFIFQCVLFVCSIVLVFVINDKIKAAGLFYFVLGGYQLLNHFIKFYNGHKSNDRKIYNRYLWIIIMVNIVWVSIFYVIDIPKKILPVPMSLSFIMLIVGFAMAVFNIKISYKEYRNESF